MALPLVLAFAATAMLACVRPADARQLKLWPFFDYTSDPETGTRNLKVLGPLIEYDSDPQYRTVSLRPLFSVRQARVGRDDEVRVLYPLITARWKPEEQTTRSLGGLISYRTTTSTDGKTLTGQHFRALPFYFYDWDDEHGSRLSVPPLYADLEHVAGYERVQMIAFPAYLRVSQPDHDRRYWLYPFYSEIGGPAGSGTAFWPVYGRMRVGDRYEGGFVAWPFYIWDARTREGETERRFISFPFYSTVNGPRRESTAYGTVLWIHTLDRTRDVESFAFPWPLWAYERQASTGDTLTLRLQPFYEERRVADDVHTYRGRDALMVLYHGERDTDRASGKTAHVFALFPGVVDEGDGTWDRGGAPALLDAMAPHDTGVRELYAPLWRAYAWDGPVDDPRVSALCGAVTREHGATTYPWRWDTR